MINDKIHISFQEGFTQNYIDGIKKTLGGEVNGNCFTIDKGPLKLKMSFHTIEGVEFNFCEIKSSRTVVIKRSPDKNPELLHLNIIKEGSFSQVYNQEATKMEAGTIGGVFLYNGLFPIEAEFPPGASMKWLGFKFNPNSMGTIYDDLSQLFLNLFEGKEAVAYRANLSNETEKLISDLFSYENLPYGKNSLISARAIEIFTNKALHFKNEVDADESFGLHKDDYEMLMEIKNKIIRNIETSFTIDELSKEFGVSTTKLKNSFKQLFGTSIYKFYNQARMDEAYRRLKSGKYSVSEIGYDLGYSSLSKFSAMFKKVKGLLPTEVLRAR